ncbi:MAG: aspartate/glutamate racemase family protein [Thermodesulfobacteriota bacterium]
MSIEKITLISTGLNTGALMSQFFAKELPEISIHNVVDDSLVKEIIANNNVINVIPPGVVRRVCSYVISAEMSGADLVVITCSSISVIARVAQHSVGIPVMRIDEPMAELAVERADRIKVLATISSTLNPSVQLIEEKSRQQGKEVVLGSFLCERARQFLDEGNPEGHDRILREEIEKALKNFDIVVLAQASMGRVLDTLDVEKRRSVLTSPALAIEHIKRKFLLS